MHEIDRPDIRPDESVAFRDERGPGLQLRYGRIVLSIVGGPIRYCVPRQYLAHISRYAAVEIAIFDMAQIDMFGARGNWTTPKALGIDDAAFASWFVHDDVEGWVSWDLVYRLCLILKTTYGGTDNTWTLDRLGETVCSIEQIGE